MTELCKHFNLLFMKLHENYKPSKTAQLLVLDKQKSFGRRSSVSSSKNESDNSLSSSYKIHLSHLKRTNSNITSAASSETESKQSIEVERTMQEIFDELPIILTIFDFFKSLRP